VGGVQGTRKKPYKQKGTGNARHGTLRAVGMVGGGVAHPPEPRDYSFQIPKKVVEGALRSALSLRNGQSALFVVSGWAPSKPSTKNAAQVLETFGGKSALVIGSREELALWRSVRNLPHAKFLPVEAINVYDILHHDQLLLTDKVIEVLTKRLKRSPSRAERAAETASAS
jgi:large subunit ribosomal protein L4